jgi:hypothetical protein
VSEEALLTRSSKAKKPMNACGHTYTKSQTPSTRVVFVSERTIKRHHHRDAAPAGEYMEV